VVVVVVVVFVVLVLVLVVAGLFSDGVIYAEGFPRSGDQIFTITVDGQEGPRGDHIRSAPRH